ncbi:MAG: HNH endonuclease [Clostridia bacterium]|nr:HNH endonuclease [Clostridia bacterium]
MKWSNALKAFVEYINQDVSDDSLYEVNSETRGHKTTRDINLRLRFKVMQRDNFKCCACGASPAKDPSVELHIDHIFPWSKGGETEIDNLQTLCSKCNLGKSDLT